MKEAVCSGPCIMHVHSHITYITVFLYRLHFWNHDSFSESIMHCKLGKSSCTKTCFRFENMLFSGSWNFFRQILRRFILFKMWTSSWITQLLWFIFLGCSRTGNNCGHWHCWRKGWRTLLLCTCKELVSPIDIIIVTWIEIFDLHDVVFLD